MSKPYKVGMHPNRPYDPKLAGKWYFTNRFGAKIGRYASKEQAEEALGAMKTGQWQRLAGVHKA